MSGLAGHLGRESILRGATARNDVSFEPRPSQEKIATRPQKNRGTFSKKVPRHNQFDFSVAIVVVVIFFVPAFVLAVVFVPAIVVAIAVMVPMMVVLEAPVRTSPVAAVVAAPYGQKSQTQ
jgi:hypothetical protein